MDWVSIIFTAFWSGVKAFFGKSDQRKLGIAETTVSQQAETLREVADAQRIDRDNGNLSLSQLRNLTGQWQRPS